MSVATTRGRLRQDVQGRSLLQLVGLRGALICFGASVHNGRIVVNGLGAVFRSASCLSRRLIRSIVVRLGRTFGAIGVCDSVLAKAVSTFTSVVSGGIGTVVGHVADLSVALVVPALVTDFCNVGMSVRLRRVPRTFLLVVLMSMFLSTLSFIVFEGVG